MKMKLLAIDDGDKNRFKIFFPYFFTNVYYLLFTYSDFDEDDTSIKVFLHFSKICMKK